MARDIGIDLGTANTLVYMKGKGIVVDEPTVVAKDKKTDKIIAVGSEAKEMLGRTPGRIIATKPLSGGVIADYTIASALIDYFLNKAIRKYPFSKTRVVISVPTCASKVERQAVKDATYAAGAKSVFLIEECKASAIGAGLPVASPTGNMIVDIGGGTTDIAVISLGGIVVSRSINVAGNTIDAAIADYVKRKYNVAIGERTAENIKIQIGYADMNHEEQKRVFSGMSIFEGLPQQIELSSYDIVEPIRQQVDLIVEAIKSVIENTPPELLADVMTDGIMLAGGGAYLRNIADVISQETTMPVRIAEDPLRCVAVGAGKVLEEIKVLESSLLE
ncbi:MAG: rod shape-determining protein [Clostridia bacterium]|jgi:rod shape-determining protein MreB|nr:rod shape-determining protein [Clostridiaceae bacterium]